MQDSELDGIFAAARAEAPLPSAALLARIEADALHEQALRVRPVPGSVPGRAPRRAGIIERMLAALGGVPVATGLATATFVGVWIGLAQPAPLSGLAEQLDVGLSEASMLDSVELIPSLDPFAAEG